MGKVLQNSGFWFFQGQVVGVDKLCKRVSKLGAQALEQDREEWQAFQNWQA
jgi:hypothetical protein